MIHLFLSPFVDAVVYLRDECAVAAAGKLDANVVVNVSKAYSSMETSIYLGKIILPCRIELDEE